jgi:hypothetical protein
MTNENKKTSDQLIFVHIFRKKHFKTNLENFMSESLNATSTPLRGYSTVFEIIDRGSEQNETSYRNSEKPKRKIYPFASDQK